MMQTQAPNPAEMPVTLSPVLNLVDQGVSAQAFRFGNLTMESDKYISVKDAAPDGTGQVVVVDMHNGNSVSRRPMKAEASLMSPADNVMALKGVAEGQPGHFIQVFNLDTKDKLGVYQSPENIVFWRWIGPRVLALVGEKDVVHWNLEVPGSAPEKIFQRGGKLAEAGSQIVSYAANSSMSWCLLTAISTQDQGQTIDGNMQLWSVEKKQQQLLEGHAGCFGNVVVADGEAAAGLFAFSERKVGSLQTKLHIMDVTKPRVEGQPAPFRMQADIAMPPEAPSDFAIALHLSEKHGVAFMVTKAGYLFIFDVATATMLVRTRVSQDTVFISTASAQTGGCVFVNRKGMVTSAKVNESAVVGYIMHQLVQLPNRQDIAFALARRFSLPGADELFQRQFSQLFASGDYKGAATIAAQCKSGILRNQQTIDQFKGVQAPPGQSSPILHYFSTLLERGRLNASESVELLRPVVQQQRRELIEKWLKQDKLECTEELGDIVQPLETSFALSIYLRAGAHQKVIGCFVAQGQFDSIVAYAKKTGYQADYSALLQRMVTANPEGAASFARSLLDGQEGRPLIDLNQVVKVGNTLSDATIAIGQLRKLAMQQGIASHKISFYWGSSSMPHKILDWAGGEMSCKSRKALMKDLSDGEGETKFTCNGDFMSHVNKGAVGMRLGFQKNVFVKDVDIRDLDNQGFANAAPYCIVKDQIYQGADVRGVSLAHMRNLTKLDVGQHGVFSSTDSSRIFPVTGLSELQMRADDARGAAVEGQAAEAVA